jgi:lantibiotic leader peptide-processing serine protease
MRTPRTMQMLVASAAVAIVGCSEPTAPRPAAPDDGPIVTTSAGISSGVPVARAVVVFKDSTSIPAAGLDLLGLLGGTVAQSWGDIGVAFVDGLSPEGLSRLRESDLVALAGYDRLVDWLPGLRVGSALQGQASLRTKQDPSQARYYLDGTQWSMKVIQADRAWAARYLGSPATRVAILDTGIDYDHRELKGLVDLEASASFTHLAASAGGAYVPVPVEPQQPGDAEYMDNHFHGTHVASTVASNGISVAAVAPSVTLVAVKVLNMLGSGTFEGVAAGIRHAAGPARAHIINMSLGAQVEPAEDGVPALLEMMRRTIREVEKAGVIVISAAGNSGINLDAGTVVATPCEQSTICVSATGPLMQVNFDQPATYTNYGRTAIHVAAPGGNASDTEEYVSQDLIIGACSRRTTQPTLAPCRTSTDGVVYFYAYAAGTSMASPHVAGQAAQIKSLYPTLSVNGLRQRILSSADDIGVKGRDIYSNWGRINVWKSLN